MTKSFYREGAASFLFAVALLLLTLACGAPVLKKRFHACKPVKPAGVHFSGAAAQKFLEQPGEGQSLMAALDAARFGLKQQEHAPFDEKSGPGYLAMSHDQNLNAWFAEDGIRVRPTVRERENAEAWQLAFRLKEYGYGAQLMAAPPIVSKRVKGTRIEYVHSFNRQSKIDRPRTDRKLIEWYENRPEGIEQGFTLNDRPQRGDFVAPSAPLQVLLAVTGDLIARRNDEGEIELADSNGKSALSYSKLVALDADGKRLATRMKATPDGREIALVVEDAGARYPVVIDPIVASLEKKLDAGKYNQADARFGFDVAIDGDRAVVGAWREDRSSNSGPVFDVGYVYTFARSGTTWSPPSFFAGGGVAGEACGWSVAIHGDVIVYGCPGANNNTGTAFIANLVSGSITELIPLANLSSGARYGVSVGVSDFNAVVGSPFQNIGSATASGRAHLFTFDSNLKILAYDGLTAGTVKDGQTGTSVAIDGNTIVVGSPGTGAGKASVFVASGETSPAPIDLFASDGASGDQFGQSVAISRDTVVVGAPFNNEKGSGAGAAYVFVRDGNGNWSQQQKLTGSDTTVSNFLGASHIAIQGNTIVAGAYGYSYYDFNNGTIQNSGEAYVFMRRGTVWTEQAILVGDNHANDEFGVGVGISGNTVIAGARKATASGVASAGAAFVYRLSCTPPRNSAARGFAPTYFSSGTVCPGGAVQIDALTTNDTGTTLSYQWRKNGVDIPNATGPSYNLSNITASDAGSYDVAINNACGGEISAPFTLAVYSFSLNPTSQNFGVSGSNGVVNVTATGSCSWTAVSNSSFITVDSGSSGTGNGTVGFTVAANPDPGQRTGTITIAGKTFSVSQDGTNCSYSISPVSQTFDANASTQMVSVTASAGCKWAAKSNDSFISINSDASGTGNGTVTYTVAANFTATQRTGTLTVAGQTVTITQDGAATPTPTPSPTAIPTPTPTPSPTPTTTPAPTSQLLNLSTRKQVGTGDNVLIGGFIVVGTDNKQVILRGLGPSLPVSGALADPTLELHDAGTILLAFDDNWKDKQQAEIEATDIPPSTDLEAAIVASLPAKPGEQGGTGYTGVLAGQGGTTGIGLLEIYDLDTSASSKLANISTRGFVGTGDDLLIGGFIPGPSDHGPLKVLVRALGPSLTAQGVSGALQDPVLELHDANGTLATDDNWKDSQQAEIEATGIPPSDDHESAIVTTLAPSNAGYTAVVRGANGSTGVGLVEVYALP